MSKSSFSKPSWKVKIDCYGNLHIDNEANLICTLERCAEEEANGNLIKESPNMFYLLDSIYSTLQRIKANPDKIELQKHFEKLLKSIPEQLRRARSV